MIDADLRAIVEQYFAYSAEETDLAREMYHEDAVLEFPQSGERFDGVENFRERRRRYPAKVDSRMRRLTSWRTWWSPNVASLRRGPVDVWSGALRVRRHDELIAGISSRTRSSPGWY